MSAIRLRPLQLSDAPRCAELVLEHYKEDPGYSYVWGHEPDLEALKQMYTNKMQRLIGDAQVRTWGAYVDNEEVVAFAAWNPPYYKKSASLSLRQKWATSTIWTYWPLSFLYPNTHTLTPLQERHRRIAAFRQPLEQDVVNKLGPNHIWVMHFAGKLDAVDAIMLDKIVAEAKASPGCAVRLSSQHSVAAVDYACCKWGFEMVSRASFTGDGESSAPIDTAFLVRPPDVSHRM